MKIASDAKRHNLKNQKIDAKIEQDAIKAKLAKKYGDKFKAVKSGDSTVVISKEAHAKAEQAKAASAITGDIKNNDPKSEATKDKIKGLLMSGRSLSTVKLIFQ